MISNKTTILMFCLLASLALLAFADTRDNLTKVKSVSLSPTSAASQWRLASAAGGAYLYIKGYGFSSRSPLSNQVYLSNDDYGIPMLDCPVVEFMTTTTQIVCQLPPAPKVDVLFTVNVISDNTGSDQYVQTCQNCKITYQLGVTPLLAYMIPNAANLGAEVDFYGVQRLSSSLDIDYVKIGDQRCDFNDQNEFNPVTFSSASYSRAPCTVTNQEAGYYSVTQKNLKNTGFAQAMNTLPTYRFGGDPYDFVVVPSITSISNNKGSSQGQVITIQGSGFSSSGQNQVQLADTDCVIFSQSSTEITCELQPRTTAIPEQGYHAGLKMDYYKNKQIADVLGGNAGSPTWSTTYLTAETLDDGDYYTTKLSGYFKAPVTGDYKFAVSADDTAQLYLSQTPRDRTNLERILKLDVSTPYRFYYKNATQLSSSVSLTSDNYYYLELYHRQEWGDGGATLGVYVPNTPNNVNVRSEVQSVSITCSATPEILKFSLSNVSGGQWNIVFKYLSDDGKTISKTLTTSNMAYNTAVTNVANQIYALTSFRTSVELQMFDSDGAETQDLTKATTYNYLVSFLSLRTNGVLPTIGATGLKGTGVSGKVTQLQSASDAIKGTFSISRNAKTVQVSYAATELAMITALKELGFVDRIRVEVVGEYGLGAKWIIQFTGDGSTPIEPLYISDSSLTGCGQTTPLNVVVETIQESSEDLFYEVIPVEFLFTAEDSPQITVKSNGITANCPNNNCQYVTEQTNLPEITAISYNAQTLILSIANVIAGDYSVDDFTVSFGNTICQVTNYADSTSPVTLTATCQTPEAGDHYPKVHFSDIGYPTIQTGVTPIQVSATISGITPSQVNPNGGSVLTITGTGFSASLELAQARNMQVQIGSSVCTLTAITPTQVQCVTSPVSAGAPLTVTLNAKTATSGPLTLLSAAPTISSISPSTVNPVLQSLITITGESFDSDITQTSVFLAAEDGTQVTQCLPATSSSTQITCQLLGAPTGTYQLYAQTSLGYSSLQTLNVKVVITSVSPSSGSNAGGTTLTIQGGTFSTIATQSLVFIGDDSVPCDVISSTEDTVQCITRAKSDDYYESPQTVYVDTRIVEPAVCEGTCTFTYLDSLTPQITSFSSLVVLPGDTVQAQGSNLGSDPTGNTPVVTISGQSCLIVSNSDTEIVFTVPNDLVPANFAKVAVHVAGKGYADISSEYATFNVTPAISSISPKSGSSAGLLLTISGAGFQPGAIVKIGNSVCAIRSLTSTTIVCKATVAGQVTLIYNDQTFKCVDTSACSFSFANNLTPTVATVAPLNPSVASSFSLTLAGTGFGLTAPTVNLVSQPDTTVSFQGTVTSNSATEVIAAFTNIAAGAYNTEVIVGGAHIASSTATVNVPLSASVTSPVLSSLAGGVTLSISGSGFFDNVQKDNNIVTVCGLPCEVTQSTPSSIQCQVPAFVNTVVQDAYPSIVSLSTLQGSTWSDAGNEANLFDLAFGTIYKSTKTDCVVGLDVGAGLLGEVREIRFAPDTDENSPSILNGTVIEGSNDNTTYTQITTFTPNTNTGWNTIDLTEQGSPVRFRYYRVRGATSAAKCALAELQFRGIVLSDNSIPSLSSVQCKAAVTVNKQTQQIATTAVTYQQSLTPNVTSISPAMGTTLGGTVLTLTGTGFSTTVANIQVTIDDVECTVTSATSTQIKCIIGPAPIISTRRSSLESEVTVRLADKGLGVTNGLTYFYVDRWSDTTTWGGVPPPREGESVSIPTGQTILLDISPPKLKAIIVEGALIFEDKDIDLHVEYIMINNGRMQIGTQENPIQNHIAVTVYGNKESSQLPTFGNKVIASMNSILDIHGKPRSHTWTSLDITADVGATSIVVQGAVDWAAGEVIIIASTDHDHYQSESRTIKTATTNAGKTTITFTDPLVHRHYAGIQTIGDQTFEMRAEVGLLSRNVVIQGDSTSQKNQYGVHIMTHAHHGDDGGISRISYTEVRQAGQAFNMGRYPIHFHLLGNVRESFVIGNAVHHTYNRAITIHGVHHLRVQNNVAYWTMGHSIFIEDGIETRNTIENNLVINTMASNSLLNTDQTPASFWITNPNNIFRGNHAAGSDRYGFWFNMPVNPTGPSATATICPRGEPLGEFTNNQAHSSGRYGLRIFNEHIPRTYPCLPYAPYEDNPPIEAVYNNFLGWKNKRNGIIGEAMGALTFQNIKVADNLRAGIEITTCDFSPVGTLVVKDAWIVGYSPENGYDSSVYSQKQIRGLITPKTDHLFVKNMHFYNFGQDMTAIETCSHCEFLSSTDTDARTQFFEGLSFDNVERRVRFNEPWKGILVDTDGSLVENGKSGVVTFFYNHLNVPGCVRNEEVYNGLVCDETITIRRVEFTKATPNGNFHLIPMVIHNLDYNPDNTFGTVNFTIVNGGWGMPFVTGYSYQIHWETRGDFSSIDINPSHVIQPDDKTFTLVFNHSEYRETYDVYKADAPKSNSTDLWTLTDANTEVTADWYHDVDNRLLYLAINGRERANITLEAVKCRENCPTPNQNIAKDGVIRLWSNASMWPNQELPKDGDDVEIPGDWTVKLDMSTASLGTLHILGDFYFDSAKDDLVLTAERIWVEGQLFIGNSTDDRYTKSAKIVLSGTRNSRDLTIGPTQAVSNKVLAVTGNVTMYGALVNTVFTRLLAPAVEGDTTITLPADIDWKVGDEIGIAPSQLRCQEYETRTIVSINEGVVTLNEPLSFYHFGAADITKETPYGTLDMRTEVALLTRNIVIEGTDEDYWGGRVFVAEVYDEEFDYLVRGRIDFDGVAMRNMAQPNTTLAGLTFDALTSANNDISVVRRCVIRDALGIQVSIHASTGITFEQNVLFKGVKFLVNFEGSSTEIELNDNLLIGCIPLLGEVELSAIELEAGIHVQTNLVRSHIYRNIIAGAAAQGFVGYAESCTAESLTYSDNVVHSGWYGWVIVERSTGSCGAANRVTAYRTKVGIVSYRAFKTILNRELILSDNVIGLSTNIGGVGENAQVHLTNSYIAGLSRVADPSAYFNKAECSNTAAIYIPVGQTKAKLIPPLKSHQPWQKPDADAIWKVSFTVSGITFENFQDNQVSGCIRNVIFRSNIEASDASANTKVTNITKINTNVDNIVYYSLAPDHWISLDNCGYWFCTGIKNMVIRDLDGTLSGQITSIIPLNPGVLDSQRCTVSFSQGAYFCNEIGWSTLVFESLDWDYNTRILSPINVTTEDGFRNDLNTYRDNAWDDFYTSLRRLSRFHSVVQSGKDYTVLFSSTLPNEMRWQLHGGLAEEELTAKFRYTQSQSVRVTDINGKVLKQKVIQSDGDATVKPEDPCGTNIFSVDTQSIIIKLTGDDNCQLTTSVMNSVRVSVRYDIPLDDFFAQDGATSFVDRVAAILGINPASIRVVQVKSGSSVVIGFIDSQHQGNTIEDSLAAQKELNDMITALDQAANNGQLKVLNAEILNYSFGAMFAHPEHLVSEPIESGANVTLVIVAVIIAVVALTIGTWFAYKKYKKRRGLDNAVAKIHPHSFAVPSMMNTEHHLVPDLVTSQLSDMSITKKPILVGEMSPQLQSFSSNQNSPTLAREVSSYGALASPTRVEIRSQSAANVDDNAPETAKPFSPAQNA